MKPETTDPPLKYPQHIWYGAVLGAILGALFAGMMLMRFSRISRPLMDQLTVPVWLAILIEIAGGAVLGAVGGAAFPLARIGLIGKLAYAAFLGAMIAVVISTLTGLSLGNLASVAGTALGGAALAVFVTGGVTFQTWFLKRQSSSDRT